jgi:type IV pilus assembly protein PilV
MRMQTQTRRAHTHPHTHSEGPAVTDRSCAAQRGFTLLEALIALVILSVGLLGVAKLVLGAVHADDSAYLRGQATQLAYELLDQMRANRPGGIAGNYAAAAANNDCSTAACSPQQLAQLDLFNWNARVQAALPGGAGTVVMGLDPANDVIATIAVSWNDAVAENTFGNAAANPAAKTVTLVSVL